MRFFLSYFLLFSFLSYTIASASPYQTRQCPAASLAEEHFKIAQQYQEKKRELKNEDEARTLDIYSLYYLRASARLAPLTARYWIQLARVELSSGQYVSALEHLQRALKLDPELIEAKESFSSFLHLMEEQGYDTEAFSVKFAQKKRQHKIKKIKEFNQDTFKELIKEKNETFSSFFSRQAEVFSQPFVVKGFLKKSKVMNAFHPKTLLNKYGEETVDFYPQGLKLLAGSAQMARLEEAVDYLYCPKKVFHGLDASKKRTYIQWNLSEERFIELLTEADGYLPSFFHDRYLFEQCLAEGQDLHRFFLLTHWKMLIIGEGEGEAYNLKENLLSIQEMNDRIENGCLTDGSCGSGFKYDNLEVGRGGPFDEGAGMFLHRDALRIPSFQMQVYGKKLWHLCPGSVSQKLKKKKESYNKDKSINASSVREYTENVYYVNTATDSFHEEEDGSEVSLFSPDYTNYPLLSSAECYEAIISPGDLIYYPQGYYHQTHCPGKDPCVSLSGSLLFPHNIPRFIGELMRECRQSIDSKTKKFTGGNVDQDFINSFYSFFVEHSLPNKDSLDSPSFSYIPPPPLNGVRFFPHKEPICDKLLSCYKEWWKLSQ